jgi:Cu/Zn superoxide dismutase
MRSSRFVVALAAVACVVALPAAASANKDKPAQKQHAAKSHHGKPGKGKDGGTLVRLAPVAGQTAKGKALVTQRPGALSLALRVSGLVPGSWHAMHVHTGSCAAQGAVALPLPDIYADEHGVATLVTTVPTGAAANFVAGGYYINVHAAGGDTPGISCGDIVATKVKIEKAAAKTNFKGAGAERGHAEVIQKGSDVSVWIKLSGLTPGAHALQLLVGTCAAPGAVAVSLGDVTAGPDGSVATKVTATSSIPVAGKGYSLAVYAAGSAAPGATVACGDLWNTGWHGHK